MNQQPPTTSYHKTELCHHRFLLKDLFVALPLVACSWLSACVQFAQTCSVCVSWAYSSLNIHDIKESFPLLVHIPITQAVGQQKYLQEALNYGIKAGIRHNFCREIKHKPCIKAAKQERDLLLPRDTA